MNDNQIAKYCEEIRETTLHQLYKIQNQRKEISILHKKCASQKAEIERLEKRLEEANRIRYRAIYESGTLTKITDELYQKIKAEAIKEFAERLKGMAWQGMWETLKHVDIDDIDYLVKEMVGDAE